MSLQPTVLLLGSLVLLTVVLYGIADMSRRHHINQPKPLTNDARRRGKEGMNR